MLDSTRVFTNAPLSARRGSSLVLALIVMTSIAVFSLYLITLVTSSTSEQRGFQEDLSAQYVCEAGLADAMFGLQHGSSGDLGSQDAPVKFGTSSYWVEAKLAGDDLISLVSTSTDNKASYRAELLVQTTGRGIYSWGAFGREFMKMKQNAFVDSYDSKLGSYVSQKVNGTGSNAYALKNGDVGSDGDVELENNAMVQGDAYCGPDATISVAGSPCYVDGSATPMASLVDMPSIVMPAVSSPGTVKTINGSTAATNTINPGSYYYSSFTVNKNSKVYVKGPCTLRLGSMLMLSNSNFEVDASGGPVDIFVENDFILSSNAHVYSLTYSPEDVRFQLVSDNVIDPDLHVDLDDIDFKSNSQIYGTVYAPSAAIEIKSNFEIFGSIVARSLLLDSWCRVHYDEELKNASEGAQPTFTSVCWRTLSRAASE